MGDMRLLSKLRPYWHKAWHSVNIKPCVTTCGIQHWWLIDTQYIYIYIYTYMYIYLYKVLRVKCREHYWTQNAFTMQHQFEIPFHITRRNLLHPIEIPLRRNGQYLHYTIFHRQTFYGYINSLIQTLFFKMGINVFNGIAFMHIIFRFATKRERHCLKTSNLGHEWVIIYISYCYIEP